MQTTATTTAGSYTDLLTGILNVQMRNEDKITEQDRQYCQLHQNQLYEALDRIDRWYAIARPHAGQRRQDTHQLGKPANNRMNMNRMEMPGSPIPTDKGSPRPIRLSKVGPQAVSGKIILAALRYFPRNPCLWRRTARSPPKTGMVSPLKQEDYESKRTYQKDSRQQVDKAPRAGCHGSRHFQLALYTRHISRMDRRGHCVFQRNLQVPLPGSLPARGTGHSPVHPESPGLLKSDSREHTPIL